MFCFGNGNNNNNNNAKVFTSQTLDRLKWNRSLVSLSIFLSINLFLSFWTLNWPCVCLSVSVTSLVIVYMDQLHTCMLQEWLAVVVIAECCQIICFCQFWPFLPQFQQKKWLNWENRVGIFNVTFSILFPTHKSEHA